jgi:hypothetical protein
MSNPEELIYGKRIVHNFIIIGFYMAQITHHCGLVQNHQSTTQISGLHQSHTFAAKGIQNRIFLDHFNEFLIFSISRYFFSFHIGIL